MTKRKINEHKAPGIGKWDRSKIVKVKLQADSISTLYWDYGKSIKDIADFIGVNVNTLYTHAKRVGVKLREQKVSMKTGANSPYWKGGVYNSDGYVRHCSGKFKNKLEHVIIAEGVLGRKLKKEEVVHHINGIRDDNRNENLMICTKSYHTWLHRMIDIKNGKKLFKGK